MVVVVDVLLHTDSVETGAAGDEVEEKKAAASIVNDDSSPAESSVDPEVQSDGGGAVCMKSDMGNIVAQETGKQCLSVLCAWLAFLFSILC